MTRAELGIKRICPVTGRKFYDLGADPIVSPYTGQSYPKAFFEPLAKAGKPAAVVKEEAETEVEPPPAEEVSLDEVEAAEEAKDTTGDDAEIEDTEADDTFLEEEEEAEDDVTGLIDGDIEGDEET